MKRVVASAWLAFGSLLAVEATSVLAQANDAQDGGPDPSIDAGSAPTDADGDVAEAQTADASNTQDAGASVDAGASAYADAAAAPDGARINATMAALNNKSRLDDEDLARKNEGGYFTAIPLAAYDPNTGFGAGARGYYYNNGSRDNPLFPVTPYLHRVFVQAYASTRGFQDHLIDYDGPNFLGSLYRVRGTLEYQEASARTYYGIGSRSMKALSFPGANRTYAHASDYDAATQAIQPDGTTYAQYNYLKQQRPLLQLALERLLFGGVLRPLIGLGFAYNRLTDYTGNQVDATDASGHNTQAREAQTLFASDCAAHRIVGCGGGWDNVLRLAVSIDTRDFEPDPNSGVYIELSNEIGTKALGSDYDYARTMLSFRGFYSPIPKKADLVIAGRAVYEVQSSGTPWTSMDNLPFIDDNHYGLGGGRTLRGFRQDRFVGPVIGLGNLEVRWTFVHFAVAQQKFALQAVPFFDIGRVWDSVRETGLKGFAHAQGGGMRIAWNEATIILVDYGFSTEDSGLYIDFNHNF